LTNSHSKSRRPYSDSVCFLFRSFFAVTDLFIQVFGEFCDEEEAFWGIVRKRGGFGAGLSNTWAKYCGRLKE